MENKTLSRSMTEAEKPAQPLGDVAPKLSGKRIKIRLEEGGKDDPSHVFLSLNGHALHVKRGEVVEVPVEFKALLDDAIQTSWHFDPESRRRTARNHLRIPYQVV